MTEIPLEPGATPVYVPHPDQLALDAEGRIGRDLPCRTCGYNLRGLAPAAGCPECGTAVGLSLQKDVLRFSDPVWVKGLADGIGMILIAVATVIAGYILLMIIGGAVGAMQSPNTTGNGSFANLAIGVFILGLVLAAMVLNLVGTWKLTHPDPGRKSEPEGVSVRAVARWTILAGWVIYAASALSSFLTPFAGIGSLPGALLLMAGFIAILVHLRRLALRIPDRSLGTQTAIVMWGFIVMWGGWLLMFLAFLAWVLLMFMGVSGGGGGGGNPSAAMAGLGMAGGMALMVFGCLITAASLVFGVWLVVLLVLYRVRFARAAEEAQAGAVAMGSVG